MAKKSKAAPEQEPVVEQEEQIPVTEEPAQEAPCEESPAGFEDWMCGAQLLLQPGDRLILRGLAPKVCAVADGNPYVLPGGNVLLQYKPNLLTVLKRR